MLVDDCEEVGEEADEDQEGEQMGPDVDTFVVHHE